uniref:Uncharacterized protein n=1 Tax=Macrostomum lignano TaxID=282301 RepID=A0A1I8FA33_9PLAT
MAQPALPCALQMRWSHRWRGRVKVHAACAARSGGTPAASARLHARERRHHWALKAGNK